MTSELKAAGRRDTVIELVDAVLSDYYTTRASMSDIAKINRVSTGTVSKILNHNYVVYLQDNYGNKYKTKFFWEDGEIMCYVYDTLRDLTWIRRHMKVIRKPGDKTWVG